ncbi:hypothetical protein V8C40DRAFT_241477 [Trichoderma camerunense]
MCVSVPELNRKAVTSNATPNGMRYGGFTPDKDVGRGRDQRHLVETRRRQRDGLGLLPVAYNHKLVRKRNTRDKTHAVSTHPRAWVRILGQVRLTKVSRRLRPLLTLPILAPSASDKERKKSLIQ